MGGGDRKPRKGGRKERDFRERSSTLSLEFPATGPSNPGELRGKVAPHGKSYAWVPVLWSFEKLRKVDVFSYLVIPCLKRHEMVLDVMMPEMTMDFGSKEVELLLDEGGYSWTTHRLI